MTEDIQICVVDDEDIVCERLKGVFEGAGYSVESYNDSKEALQRLAAKRFDILITDLKMAQPDGLDLMRFTIEKYPQTRVIVITGFATVETARQALKDGAVDFIAKPFRISQLLELVDQTARSLRS